MESSFRLFYIYRLLPINRAGWQLGIVFALVEAALYLFSLTVFYVIILSGALSICLYFTTLGSYISVLVVFKTLSYLAGAVKSFSSLISAILAEDLRIDCGIRA